MQLRYLLRDAVLGSVPEIEISKEQYDAYASARKVLSNSFAIEEKYEILISNYLEFEKEILNATAESMVRRHLDYEDFFNVLLGLNIRLVNLLTAARLYVDQLNQNVRKCVPNLNNAKEIVKGLFSKECEDHPEYRFMEALRNWVQHRGIPVHWVQPDGQWTSKIKDGGLYEYCLELASLRSFLEEDGEFKKKVLEELPDKIDLKAATRRYIESISNVHESAREIIAQAVTSARELIEDAHRQYAAVYSESLEGLSACVYSDGRQISSVPLLLNWDDIRVRLQKRNDKLTNLSKRYVTGSIKHQNK